MIPRLPSAADIKMMVAFPRVTIRAMRGWLRAFAGLRRPLHGVEFCVTYQCLLDCPHCLTKLLIDEKRKEMSKEQATRAIRELADLGAIFVNITGGEPLLRADIFDILAEATKRRDLLVTLASSGLTIDRKIAEELKKVRVGIVVLSLDGPDAASHDACRGMSGAFDALMKAVQELGRVKMPVWFTTILTKENARDGSIFETARLAQKLGGVLTVNWAYAVGKNWSDREGLVGEAEREAFRRLMLMPHVRWEGSSNFLEEGCPAGTEKLYVTPYGDVFPCACIQASFGNMLEMPVAEIWRKMGRIKDFDGRHKSCLVSCDENFIRDHFAAIQKNPGSHAEDIFNATDGRGM